MAGASATATAAACAKRLPAPMTNVSKVYFGLSRAGSVSGRGVVERAARRSPTTPIVYDPDHEADSQRDGDMAVPIRVVVVDDQPAMLTSLTRMLARVPVTECVGEGRDGFDAIRLVETLDPDVLLIEADALADLD